MSRFAVTTARAYATLRFLMPASEPTYSKDEKLVLWDKQGNELFNQDNKDFILCFDATAEFLDEDQAQDWLYANSQELEYGGGDDA